MLSPKLTTIRQDTDKIGREAADRLISIIKSLKQHLWRELLLKEFCWRGNP